MTNYCCRLIDQEGGGCTVRLEREIENEPVLENSHTDPEARIVPFRQTIFSSPLFTFTSLRTIFTVGVGRFLKIYKETSRSVRRCWGTENTWY